MRRILLLLVIATSLLSGYWLMAQTAEDILLSPGSGSRDAVLTVFLPPIPNAPFQAIVETEVTRHLPGGILKTSKNYRLIARDGKGRIYQEYRKMVDEGVDQQPKVTEVEIIYPESHSKYSCDATMRRCRLSDYSSPLAEQYMPAGPLENGRRYLSRENLGVKVIDGLETVGYRETITLGQGTAQNPAPVDFVQETWHSPKLEIDLQVTRTDPKHADQTLTVTSLSIGEPDPSKFSVPERARIQDLRTNAPRTTKSAAAGDATEGASQP
jgi:hypothetical protein